MAKLQFDGVDICDIDHFLAEDVKRFLKSTSPPELVFIERRQELGGQGKGIETITTMEIQFVQKGKT